MNLDRTKGSGFSRVYGVSTKGDFLEHPDCVEIVVATLLLYLSYDPIWASELNATQLHSIGLLDPEGIKVKKEVHPVSKAHTGRWRLIFLGSTRLEILDRILHIPQNTLEVALFQSGLTHDPALPTFGSCVGMGHDDDRGELLISALKRIGMEKGGQCQDASGFDLLTSAATLYCDGYRRGYLAMEGGAPMSVSSALMLRAVTMGRHIFHIGTDLHAPGHLGVMGSGLFSTACSNSFNYYTYY